MGTFKKGLFLGSVLGAGLMWLGATKKGRAMRDEIIDHAAVIYEQAKDKMKKSKTWKKMKKSDYVKLVEELVDTYAVKNGLADDMKRMLTRVLDTQWRSAQKSMQQDDMGMTK